MALRTVCAAALRSGTDLGVNNARTFVTTGIVTILLHYIAFTLRHVVPGIQSCMYGGVCAGLHQFEADPLLHAVLFCGERHVAKPHREMRRLNVTLVVQWSAKGKHTR